MTIRSYQTKAPAIGKSVYIDPMALVIGDVVIGTDSSVWPFTVIRGDMHRIRIGERSSVQDGSVLHITHASHYNPEGYPLTIGSDVTVGHQAILHGCTLHNKILIGMGAQVLDGAVIEDEVILGAGSLVPPNKVLKSGYLYLGSPAKQVRPLNERERSFFTYTAANYVKLKDHYLADMSTSPNGSKESKEGESKLVASKMLTAKLTDLEMQSAYQEDLLVNCSN